MLPPTRAESRRYLDRTRARAWLVQIFYAWDLAGAPERAVAMLDRTLATRAVSPRREPYIRTVLQAFDDHRSDVDRKLEEALHNWRLERLSPIDRSILRVAATEMLHIPDVPPTVSIHEALQLAERYGGADSSRFVNGVLDALYRRTCRPEEFGS